MNERIIDLLHEMMEARTEFLTNDTIRAINYPARTTLIGRFLNTEQLVLELVNRIHSTQIYGDLTTALLTVTLPGGQLARNFSDPVPVTPSTNQINAGLESIETASSPCAVCQDPITSGGVRIRACRHEYHRSCISNWFSMSVRCPVCRYDIREAGQTGQTSAASSETIAPAGDQ